MAHLSGIVGKLRRAVHSNPDAVRGGLDKFEGVINTRTGGKYADKLRKGRRGVDGALGVPSQTRDGFRAGRADDVRPGPVPPPSPVDRPGPIDGEGPSGR